MARVEHSRIGSDISVDLDIVGAGTVRTIVSVSARNETDRAVLVTVISALGERVIRVAAGTRTPTVTMLPLALEDDDSLQVCVRLA